MQTWYCVNTISCLRLSIQIIGSVSQITQLAWKHIKCLGFAWCKSAQSSAKTQLLLFWKKFLQLVQHDFYLWTLSKDTFSVVSLIWTLWQTMTYIDFYFLNARIILNSCLHMMLLMVLFLVDGAVQCTLCRILLCQVFCLRLYARKYICKSVKMTEMWGLN